MFQKLLPWVIPGLLIACGGKTTSAPPGAPPFVVPSAQLEQTVTVHLEPGILGTGMSADGRLSIVAPTGAVAEPTDITISKLAAAARPAGVVGDVYVLGPAATLTKPIRLRLTHGAPADGLRLVRLDTGAASYRVLDRWVYVTGTETFAGSTSHLAAFALSDGSGPDLTNDRAPTRVAEANEALAQGAVAVARALYGSATTADPNDLQAHFGTALTRLLLLPEHQAVDDVLTLCAEPVLDVQNILLGPDGLVGHAIDHRQGSSTLSIETGPDLDHLVPMELEPNEIQSTLETWDGGQGIYVKVRDNESGTSGAGIRVTLDVEPTDPAWSDDGTIDLADTSDGIWPDLSFPTNDGDISVGPGGTFIEAAGGSVRVVHAGTQVGQAVEIEFQEAVFEKIEDDGFGGQTVLAVYRINGSMVDTLFAPFDPEPGTVAFEDLVFDDGPPERSEPVQAIEACGTTLTQTTIKQRLEELSGEMNAVRDHLDAIGNHPQADTFSWKLPVGTFANGIEVPVGIVEVHVARALLNLADAAHELVQAYDIIDPALPASSLFSRYDRYDTWCSVDCSSGPCIETCDTDVRDVFDIDLGVLHGNFTGYFLTPTVGATFGAADVAAAEASLDAAIDAGVAALTASPTEDVLMNFRVDTTTAAAADELIAFAHNVAASLDTDVVLANTPEWILHAHQYFDTPFTAASLLNDPDVDTMWDYTPPVEPLNCEPGCENADLVPNMNMVFTALESFITLPTFPDDTIYCVLDGECSAAGQTYWVCSGYEDEGVCANDMTTPCWSWDDCGSMIECITSTCAPRDPQFFDYDEVGDAYDGGSGLPRFINEDLAAEIAQGF